MNEIRGIIHVHSTYSYDGQHSLKEIAEMGRKRGYSFIGMSEHSDTMTKQRMAEYVEQCNALSSPDCLLIPGIEFTCDKNLHIVGLGLQQYSDKKKPAEVARFISSQGGVAIIAHPRRYGYEIPLDVSGLVNGIEVWNAGYDGRFVPNDASLKLLKMLRRYNSSILAYGGQDLHRITDQWFVEITVSCETFESESILLALKKGEFMISNPYFKLNSLPDIGWTGRIQIHAARRLYDLMKWAHAQIS